MRGNGRVALAVVAGLAMVFPRSVPAQGLLPPAPGQELERLSRRMAEAVRDLGEDIVAGVGQTPAGQYLARDAQELERSTGEWYASLRGVTDPYQVRRSYSGIDAAWHRLRGQLGAPGVASPAIAEELARVDRVDSQLHQALNLNAYPPNFDAAPAAPSGFDETRRLAAALAQRGEALAAVIQADYGQDPRFGGLINNAAELARVVDTYYDGMGSPAVLQQPLDYARSGFVPIFQRSNGLGISLGATNMPPRVRAAWEAYTSVHNLLRANLGLVDPPPGGAPQPLQPPPPPQPPIPGPVGIPYVANPTASVAQWVDELDRQVDELLENFAPTARVVPEGRDMLEEMTRLRSDVRNFRGALARGLDPGRLAHEYREVDADWQRLARRFNRVARGRTGPNIQRVQQIGQTCEQIHRVLGMPGYPPTIGPFEEIR
jgi:hypothetical protein